MFRNFTRWISEKFKCWHKWEQRSYAFAFEGENKIMLRCKKCGDVKFKKVWFCFHKWAKSKSSGNIRCKKCGKERLDAKQSSAA